MGRGVVGMVDETCRTANNTAIIFPGQGSQSPLMAAAYDSQPLVAAAIAEASAAINVDLAAIILDKSLLDQTANTQPALLAVCVGVFRAARLPAPLLMAGHSLGEYAALVCSDAVDFVDAVRLTRRRGELMQSVVGGMAAIIGAADTVDAHCAAARQQGARIWAVNYNSPQQTVVAGDAAAIAACQQWTADVNIKRIVPLSVSVPSHCPLMQPAAAAFMADLQSVQWRTPSSPVLHNACGQSCVATDIPSVLAAQLTQPVRWTDMIAKFSAAGVERLYECGPGGVLCGLARRMPSSPPHVALASAADLAVDARCRRCSLPLPLPECADCSPLSS